MEITLEQALDLLERYDPEGPGEDVDERQTVPWTCKKGPFGSWPATIEDAEATLRAQDKPLALADTLRVGWCILYDGGRGYTWGFSADNDKARALIESRPEVWSGDLPTTATLTPLRVRVEAGRSTEAATLIRVRMRGTVTLALDESGAMLGYTVEGEAGRVERKRVEDP